MSSQSATRDTVLLAALRVLAREGVPAASTRAIAAEADVNVAALHYHFGSKDGLLAEVFDALSAQFAETVRAAIPTAGGISEAIDHGMRAVWRLAVETPGLQLAQYELTTAALRGGEADRARAQYAAYQRVIVEVVEETLQESGETIAVSAEDLVAFLVAGMDGLILSSLVQPEVTRGLDLFITAALGLADPRPSGRRKSA
jgi:AcrR family transcriptional regulator